jgi:hypothetical protein
MGDGNEDETALVVMTFEFLDDSSVLAFAAADDDEDGDNNICSA